MSALKATTPTLVWNDEFNGAVGTAPNPANWTYDTGAGGWGNNELETYTTSTANASIVSDPQATDGLALAITAVKSGSTYSSARIKTEGLYSFTYGRLEARVKLPTGQGLWPAFWALGANIGTVGWPQCGEMDIMEWGQISAPSTQTNQTSHWSSSGSEASYGGTYNLPTSYNSDYHVFAIDWYPTYLIYSVDGNVVSSAELATSSIPAFGDPFFILLNMAVGGNFTTSPPPAATAFPQTYSVDYVRVYSLPATPPSLTQLEWAPSAPQSPSVSVSGTTATVTWQAPFSTFGSAITQYVVQRATDSGFTQNVTSWTISPALSYADASINNTTNYFYRVQATTALGTSDPSSGAELEQVGVTPTPTPTPTPNPGSPSAHLINLSVRSTAGSGSQTLIGGFVVGGTGSENVLVRGDGPVLTSFQVSGALKDPVLTLYNSTSTSLASNSAWGGGATLSNAFSQVGAFALPAGSNDTALLSTLSTGAYTAAISSTSGDSGVALVEIYDADTGSPTSRFVNLSARSEAGTGSQTLIAGFVVAGNGTETLLIRGDGPVLTSFNVAGALTTPQLTLFDSNGNPIVTNTGWSNASVKGSSPVQATYSSATSSVFSQVGAFALPAGSADCAVVVTVPAGNYTAQVTGVNSTTGVALVEVYEIPTP